LSGLQLNISGIIGPALGGLLVPLAGAKFVFAVNAACFLVVVVATRQWKQPAVLQKLSSESFFHSFWTVIRYVRSAPNFVTLLANLLIVLAYALMAFVHQTEAFFVVAALAGVGWTMSASELWVAAQRAMPSWARGRLNATFITISQGAMVLGGVIWGFAASIAGVSYTLLGAAVLFLTSLLLAARLFDRVSPSFC
jgi:Transmembrane secretion effector